MTAKLVKCKNMYKCNNASCWHSMPHHVRTHMGCNDKVMCKMCSCETYDNPVKDLTKEEEELKAEEYSMFKTFQNKETAKQKADSLRKKNYFVRVTEKYINKKLKFRVWVKLKISK